MPFCSLQQPIFVANYYTVSCDQIVSFSLLYHQSRIAGDMAPRQNVHTREVTNSYSFSESESQIFCITLYYLL